MMAIIHVLPGSAAKEAPKARGIPAKTTRREAGIVNWCHEERRECEVGLLAAVASSGFEIFADPPSRISYEDSANRLNTLGFPSFSDAIRIWHR
jgi:hypothetical protein